MARTFRPEGTLLNPLDDFRIRRPIQVAGGDFGGIDRVALNMNSIYANWSPTLAAFHCPFGGEDGAGDQSSTVFSSDSSIDFFALRFLVPPDDIHRRVKPEVHGWANTISPPLGTVDMEVKIRAVQASTAGVMSFTTTTPGFRSDDPFAVAPDASGRETLIVSARRVVGTLDEYGVMRHVHLAFAAYDPPDPMNPQLPAGIYNSGWWAADMAQYAANRPLSVGAIRSIEECHRIMRDKLPWPVGVRVGDLRVPPGKGQGMTWGGTAARMMAMIPYFPRSGEGVTHLSVSVLGKAGPAGGSLVVETAQGSPIQQVTRALPTAFDPEDPDDWFDEELSIQGASTAGEPVWVRAWISATDPGELAGLYSVCVQELPR